MPQQFNSANGGGYSQGYGGHHSGRPQQQHQQGYQGGPNYPQMGHQQQGGYQGQQQQHQHGGGQQQDPNAELEAEVKKYLPAVLRMCRSCCTVM